MTGAPLLGFFLDAAMQYLSCRAGLTSNRDGQRDLGMGPCTFALGYLLSWRRCRHEEWEANSACVQQAGPCVHQPAYAAMVGLGMQRGG